jgi:Arc/MetJ family transcription regulator
MVDSMKTTIEIDEKTLKAAQRVLGTTTIKGTVDASLKEVVRQRQLRELADALGTIEIDLSPDQLRRQRAKRTAHASR